MAELSGLKLYSTSEMTYIVSGGAFNFFSLTLKLYLCFVNFQKRIFFAFFTLLDTFLEQRLLCNDMKKYFLLSALM